MVDSAPKLQAALFDLDGTLADTAPDLNFALNEMRARRGLAELPLALTRPLTSQGARGMLGVGFSVTPEHADYEKLRDEFLKFYGDNVCRSTVLFPGMEALLVELDKRSVRWGIVTNKAERFAHPLLECLGLRGRAACIVGGDTTAHMKPHPAPLLAASTALDVRPGLCLYVGDDERDVRAARAARMGAVVALFGYLDGSDPATWNADAMIDHPSQLLEYFPACMPDRPM